MTHNVKIKILLVSYTSDNILPYAKLATSMKTRDNSKVLARIAFAIKKRSIKSLRVDKS